jgi:preprotein translocase subunit YajC
VQDGGQLLLLLVLIVFTVWVFTRGRRQQREMHLTQSRVQPGVEVMTTSGLYGRVVDVTDDGIVRLETSPGVVSRWNRRAVARIVSAPTPEAALEDEPVEAEPVERVGVDPAGTPPADGGEGEIMTRSEPDLPVAPGPPADPEPDRPMAPGPGERGGAQQLQPRPPATEPPGSIPSAQDAAPPDRS